MNVVGWREWVVLPDLGIPGVKAKVDTGAKTSCLHAFNVTTRELDGIAVVDFKIHPLRKRKDIVIECRSPLIDRRIVRDSGGHVEERCVIKSTLQLGEIAIPAEFTLTSRDDMIFPMLLGRRAIEAGKLLVDVTQSYAHGKISVRSYETLIEEISR